MGYEAGAVNSMDCAGNPHEPSTSDRKWYIRTTGPDASTVDCQKLQTNSDETLRCKMFVTEFSFHIFQFL